MGSSALGLLLAGVLAVGVGVAGTVAVANIAVVSSDTAADQANSHDLEQPAGYGAR
jgi:hypothetical protein